MIHTILEIFCVIVMLACIANIVYIKIKNKKHNVISFKESMTLIDLPVATFYNHGVKLNFLLDTGSTLCHINSSIICDLDHELTGGCSSFIGFNGAADTCFICKMTVTNGKKEFEHEFTVTNLDNSFNAIERESGLKIHGVLGSRFFEKYKYILDLEELIAYTK